MSELIQRFSAREPDAFAEFISVATGQRVAIEPTRPGRFEAAALAGAVGGSRLFNVHIDHSRVLERPEPESIAISVPLDRPLVPLRSRLSVEPGACFLRAGEHEMDVEANSSVLVVMTDAKRARDTARALSDAEVSLPDPNVSLLSPKGIEFRRCVDRLWNQLCRGATELNTPGAAADAELALTAAVAGLLVADKDDVPATGDAAVRRVEQYILAHLDQPISRAEFCTVAQCSVRSLSRAFHRRHGVGPMTFLKARRLDAARAALLAADPGTCRVTDVAGSFGLSHLGRFSVDYGKAFGESPSETLRRGSALSCSSSSLTADADNRE